MYSQTQWARISIAVLLPDAAQCADSSEQAAVQNMPVLSILDRYLGAQTLGGCGGAVVPRRVTSDESMMTRASRSKNAKMHVCPCRLSAMRTMRPSPGIRIRGH